MVRKILIGRRNFVADPLSTFSGGNWALPLANMQDIEPQIVAEAHDNTPAYTTFDINLGAQRTVGAFNFANLRLSINATMRLRAGTDPTFATTTFDTTTIAAWPTDTVAPGYNQWGEFTLTGAYSSDEYVRLGLTRFFVPSAPVAVRYIRFEAHDTTDEVVRIGVFGAWEVWAPPRNLSFGRTISIIDESEVQTVPGGATFVVERGVRQRHSFALNSMPDTEIWLRGFGVALIKGRSKPLIVVPDPDDTNDLEKKSIYGLLSNAPEFTNPFFGLWQQTFQVDQLI